MVYSPLATLDYKLVAAVLAAKHELEVRVRVNRRACGKLVGPSFDNNLVSRFKITSVFASLDDLYKVE